MTHSPIRIGVIGCGGISQTHLKALADAAIVDVPHVLTAFCDVDREKAIARRREFGSPDDLITADYLELLDSGKVDAALIATPHPFHAEAAIAAFERGIHVLLEKPVAITVNEARAINAAHAKSKTAFTVHFQNRHDPRYRWVKDRIAEGLVGRLYKANVTLNHWFRPQPYYDSGTWRGKWASEGGGVMMNQCPHDLDLFTWWLGLPETVDAKIWLGRCHDIEVEDEIVALMTFAGGGIGIMNSTTCECPGPWRWDVVGENGALIIDPDRIEALRRPMPLSQFTRTSKELWSPQKLDRVEMRLPDKPPLAGTYGAWRNFLATIRGDEKIIMDGEEGALSVELANAVIASGFLGRPVKLPLDGKLYDDVLARLRAGESGAAMTPQRGKNKV
jgi:predicted dehydrogenase